MTIIFGQTLFGAMVFGDNPITAAHRHFTAATLSVAGSARSASVAVQGWSRGLLTRLRLNND